MSVLWLQSSALRFLGVVKQGPPPLLCHVSLTVYRRSLYTYTHCTTSPPRFDNKCLWQTRRFYAAGSKERSRSMKTTIKTKTKAKTKAKTKTPKSSVLSTTSSEDMKIPKHSQVEPELINVSSRDLDPSPKKGPIQATLSNDPRNEDRPDSLRARIGVRFPLSKEALPTLIPQANSPRVGHGDIKTFAQLMNVLAKSNESELIYQAEPHRLYFVFAYAMAITVAVYGILFLDWAFELAWQAYQDNPDRLPTVHNIVKLIGRSGLSLALFGLAAGVVSVLLASPSKVVRKIVYVPSAITRGEPLIRLSVYSMIPGKPSPIITLPLSHLSRAETAKIFTSEGFYGTASKSQFMFFLFEKGHRWPYVIDRKGWFWGDGRVMDVLFGKESIQEAEKGTPYYVKYQLEQRESDNARKLLVSRHNREKAIRLATAAGKDPDAEPNGRIERAYWWVLALVQTIKQDLAKLGSFFIKK